MVELRKRKAPPPPPVPAKKKAATGTGRKPGRPKKTEDEKPPAEDAKKAADEKPAADGKEAEPAAPTAGATIELDGFGGEIETHDGNKTTLKQLVEESKAGVVLFTYPKANTPGCELACPPLSAPLTLHRRHRPSVRFP
jgi:peroxiredoxin Q/BCP